MLQKNPKSLCAPECLVYSIQVQTQRVGEMRLIRAFPSAWTFRERKIFVCAKEANFRTESQESAAKEKEVLAGLLTHHYMCAN